MNIELNPNRLVERKWFFSPPEEIWKGWVRIGVGSEIGQCVQVEWLGGWPTAEWVDDLRSVK